jgi:uncharacterized membrane protein
MESIRDTNVAGRERWVSTLAGAAIAASLLKRRRSIGEIALGLLGAQLVYRGLTGRCALYRLLGLSTAHKRQGWATTVPFGEGTRIVRSIWIDREPADLYRFWRNLENLPHFLSHVESVEVLDDQRSRWTVDAGVYGSVEWTAEIHNEIENERIAWRSLPGADVDHAGTVRFERGPDGRGTDLVVEMEFRPPLGKTGSAVAAVLGADPERKIEQDLERLKTLMEPDRVFPSGAPLPASRRRARGFRAGSPKLPRMG